MQGNALEPSADFYFLFQHEIYCKQESAIVKLVISRISALMITIAAVVIASIFIEITLDKFNITGHRFFTGIFGVALLALSFGYSLRKRNKAFKSLGLAWWLRAHEWLAILGTVVIFVHTGTHFRALLPVITLIFMFTAFISGLIGRHVYENIRAELRQRREEMKKEGIGDAEIEDRLSSMAVASGALARWRHFHMPVIFTLLVMIVYHRVSALYFRGF